MFQKSLFLVLCTTSYSLKAPNNKKVTINPEVTTYQLPSDSEFDRRERQGNNLASQSTQSPDAKFLVKLTKENPKAAAALVQSIKLMDNDTASQSSASNPPPHPFQHIDWLENAPNTDPRPNTPNTHQHPFTHVYPF